MAQMTKAQLVDENIRLRAECDRLETKCEALRREAEKYANIAAANVERNVPDSREGAKPVGQREPAPHPLAFDASRQGYYRYVNARRAWCKAFNRPISYKTYEQYCEAHANEVYQ